MPTHAQFSGCTTIVDALQIISMDFINSQSVQQHRSQDRLPSEFSTCSHHYHHEDRSSCTTCIHLRHRGICSHHQQSIARPEPYRPQRRHSSIRHPSNQTDLRPTRSLPQELHRTSIRPHPTSRIIHHPNHQRNHRSTQPLRRSIPTIIHNHHVPIPPIPTQPYCFGRHAGKSRLRPIQLGILTRITPMATSCRNQTCEIGHVGFVGMDLCRIVPR